MEPEPAPHHRRRGDAGARAGTEGREPSSSYLFYDCQTDDVRLVLTVLGEAERFGAVLANGCEATGLVERDGAPRGCSCATA